MPYFVRHRQADERGHVGFCLLREPGHAIHVNRGKGSGTGRGVNQRVTELQLPAGRRRPWKPYEPYRELGAVERRIAHIRRRLGRHVATGQPARADAGSGQDRGCCTQSNRLIRCRHDCRVVHAHLNVGVGSPRDVRSAIRCRPRDTDRDGHQPDRPRNRECVSHEPTVRRLGKCLNALKVTGGETLVTWDGISGPSGVTSEIIPYGRPTPSPVRIF